VGAGRKLIIGGSASFPTGDGFARARRPPTPKENLTQRGEVGKRNAGAYAIKPKGVNVGRLRAGREKWSCPPTKANRERSKSGPRERVYALKSGKAQRGGKLDRLREGISRRTA